MDSSRYSAAEALFPDGPTTRRDEIIAAACDVFAERGYDGGTMRDIARVVGVSEPALYRHFENKDALFLAVMEAVASQMRERGFALMSAARANGLREQLVFAFADRRVAVQRYGPVLRTMLVASSRNEAFMSVFRREIAEPARDTLTATAARLDAEFGIADAEEDREGRVRALMALFIGTLVSGVVMADAPDEVAADAALRVMRWA